MPYKGGKRKKKRTHKVLPPGAEKDKTPRCLVLRRGNVAKPVVELVHDLRTVMMPFTAPRLRERRSNTLRDFVDVAAPLGVTHLMFLSQSAANTHLRLGRLPHGPTLTFRLETYALARAVRASQKRPVDISASFEHPPLVVLHGFNAAASAGGAKAPGTAGVSLADALKMTTTVLQNAFPQIQPATVKVSSCKRVVLFHYDAETGVIEFRHFHVRTAAVGLSRAVRKVAASQSSAKHLPNLAALQDVSEFMLSGGRTGAGGAASDSEAEGDETSRVAVPGGGSSGGAGSSSRGASQSAIKLTEIGPRMSLRLLKIEQDLAKGEVLFHALQTRTVAEAAALRAAAADKERLKAERKAVQEANVARKAAEAAAKKAAKAERVAARQEAAKKAASEGRLADEDEEDEGEDERASDNDGGADDADAESEDDDAAGGAVSARRGAAAAADDDEDEDEDDDGDDDEGDDDAFDDDASLQSDEGEDDDAARAEGEGGSGVADDGDDDDEDDEDDEEEEEDEDDDGDDDDAASDDSEDAPAAGGAGAAALRPPAPSVGDKRKVAASGMSAKPAAAASSAAPRGGRAAPAAAVVKRARR